MKLLSFTLFSLVVIALLAMEAEAQFKPANGIKVGHGQHHTTSKGPKPTSTRTKPKPTGIHGPNMGKTSTTLKPKHTGH